MHKLRNSTKIITDIRFVDNEELEEMLDQWTYHETILDTTIYQSKIIDRKFMIVRPCTDEEAEQALLTGASQE